MRPSPKTSIFAPTRCAVDPVVATIVTSAAGSPRSSASATAAKTSRFICVDYTVRPGRPPDLSMQIAGLARFGAGEERLVDHLGAVRAGELASLGVDVHEGDV